MNRIFALLPIVGIVGFASQAPADDVVAAAGTAQQNKVMEECITKHSAANSKMSRADLEKICQDQMNAQKDSDKKTSGAPTN